MFCRIRPCMQAMYQMLETGFVGLIFSVFNSDAATSGQHIQVTAFQSVPQEAGLHMLGSGTLEGLDQQTKDALRASAAGTNNILSCCIGWRVISDTLDLLGACSERSRCSMFALCSAAHHICWTDAVLPSQVYAVGLSCRVSSQCTSVDEEGSAFEGI